MKQDNKQYGGNDIPMIALWRKKYHHLVIIADFLMSETQQRIIAIILNIYSSYFLKVLVELIRIYFR